MKARRIKIAVREETPKEEEEDFKGNYVDSLLKLRPSFSKALEARQERRKNRERSME